MFNIQRPKVGNPGRVWNKLGRHESNSASKALVALLSARCLNDPTRLNKSKVKKKHVR